LEYASRRADENGLKISFSFASNGSVINERIIAAIKKYKVKANISFDILEEVQNVQRKHYDIVCNTLDRLFDADIIPSINAVITPLNVLLQEKMVAEIHRRFPKIKRLSFDPVIDASLFEDANDLRKFYSDYTDSFFRARKLGEMLDVNVNCIKLRNLDLLRDRACQGGFDLTPYGTISSCFCISSPKEALYDTFIYGKTDGPGQLVFDTEKFRENQGDRLAGKEQCRDCFAKYHCGGGCLYNYKSYSQEMQEELCRFTREFTRMALLERMADRHPNRVSSPADYTKLSVLLNYKCNFSCTYCYSAKGRSVDEISITDLKAMLDFFIDGSRIESRDLTIFFSGGGEPLLSWDRLKFALEYADVLARKEGFRMNYILITNGSLLDDPIINCLVEHKVNVCVSFEILEEIQNRHRGHYDQVVRGISALISHGLIPSISSVITAQNVDLMEQMVEKINGLFPEIRNLNFDPVADPGAFSTVEELKAFYDAFIDNYFKAHRLSRSRNCGLNCTMRVKYENTGERYCQGKLCLTPLGSVSICHSVSSPKEAAFEKCSYGLVKEGNEPEFDLEKFEALINTNANSYPECKNCFARLHCGGGCLIYRNNYSPEMFEGVCYYTRQFVKRMQLNILNNPAN
jgi:radical SAM protein with 4Fe4S-binding SPASM domain